MTVRTRVPRRGTIVPMLAIACVAMFTFVALAIDLGMLAVARTECQNAADAAALAGARQLNNEPGVADGNRPAAIAAARADVKANLLYNANFTDANIQAVDIGLYDYNTSTQKFALDFSQGSLPAGKSWTAARVAVVATAPTFFAKVIGVTSMPTAAVGTAVHRPRDIAIVLDFSLSMRFGSMSHWENGYGGSTGPVYGSMNPDPAYPKFGHYGRYTSYKSTGFSDPAPTSALPTGAGTPPTSRANPLCLQVSYQMASGEVSAPNNHTVETPGGPPVVFDFRFDPSNLADPSQKVSTVNPNNLWSAFHRWYQTPITDNPPAGMDPIDRANPFMYATMNPRVLTATDMGSYVQRTFDWSGYDPLDTTNNHGPVPAPDSFADQADWVAGATTVPYAGDRHPRKKGQAGTTYDPTAATGPAVNLAELLGWTTTFTTGTWPPNPPSRGKMAQFPGMTYKADWSDFRDATWEAYGYDMDVADYIASRPANQDPRTQLPSNTTGGVPGQVKVTAGKFKGYSMGPGYWGKTFFIWPPDPRPALDWRRRFFLRGDGAALAPNQDNDTTVSGTQSISQALLRNGTGHALNSATNGGVRYKVNYPAVLAWIKSGPQTLPPNLRSGRILYYSSIPNDVTNLSDPDQRFWREYIDFVLGYTANTNYDPTMNLSGVENVAWPEGGTVKVGATAGFPTGLGDPPPYTNYADNPSRPRSHLWFGPTTMMDFLTSRQPRRLWWSGTTREAQCWQLKSAMNSALDDIRANHPNDYAGLCYFAFFNFSTPRAPMGQDWTTLKNALFYPGPLPGDPSKSLLPLIKAGDTTTEERPYTASFGDNLVGNLPNANGGTDPNTGFAQAYNLLSSTTSSGLSNVDYPTRGRRGAAKLVIYETDGVPNSTPAWSLNAAGQNSYYQNSGTSAQWTGDAVLDTTNLNTSALAALAVVNQIVAPVSNSGASGYSTPTTPARVYAIGFGDLFEGYDGTTGSLSTGMAQDAVKFLLRTQQLGNTAPRTATATLPVENVITGPYRTRIENLRTTLQRIMQSGVQVTLIE